MSSDDERAVKEDQERARSMAEARVDWEQNKNLKISLGRKVDELKSGHWWIWECEAESSAGNIKKGFIESDGHNHELSTFEEEA